jgi:hypothetical protein
MQNAMEMEVPKLAYKFTPKYYNHLVIRHMSPQNEAIVKNIICADLVIKNLLFDTDGSAKWVSPWQASLLLASNSVGPT